MSFSNDELKKYLVDNLEPLVPSGHRGAFIVHVDDAGVRTAVAFKTENQWEIVGQVGWYPVRDGFNYGINVTKSW